MIQRAIDHAIREKRQIITFLFVGGVSFGIYIGTYAIFSRVLFVSVSRAWLNIAAVLCSVVFNFLAHRNWTYRAKAVAGGAFASQAFRYGLVVGSSAALNALLFWAGHSLLGFYDIFVAILAAGICAVYTYVAHRLFTFNLKQELIDADFSSTG